MSNKLKFAVVGCGHIGKRHAELVLRNKDCELVALVDLRPQKQLDIDHLNAVYFPDLHELLSSDIGKIIDVIIIATPNGLHVEQAIECLEARKHIVLEKPIATSKSDAEKVIFKALQMHRQVFVVMQNRYSPPSIWLKSLLDSSKLGKIFLVQINCFWNRDQRYYQKNSWHGNKQLDGGTLFTQFSHFIDLMYWCFGDITNIRAKFKDFNHDELTDFEDTGVLGFDFINGGIGCLNYTTSVWDKNLESSITVIAENGSLKIGGQYMNKVEYCHIKDYEMRELEIDNPDNDYGAYKGTANNLHIIIENVVDVLKNGKSTVINVLDGLKIVDIIERIYNS